MNVVEPSDLLREAARALRPVQNEVVVVGAAAIEVALHGVPALITPTRDVDVVVDTVDSDAARNLANREEVAFVRYPETRQLWVASPACLIALKLNAFGRTRPPDNEVVRRDFHDVYLLVDHVPDQVLASYGTADGGIRRGVRDAVGRLLDRDGDPLRFAASEMVRLGEAHNQRDAEAEIFLVARAFAERL